MASTIQIAAAQMISQSNETASSTSDVAAGKQDRLSDKRKECYKKEEQIRDRQKALEAELEEASDDSFVDDAVEGVLEFFSLDIFGNEEEELNAEIQKLEVEAQGMEAAAGLVGQDLQRLTKQVSGQIRAAQSAERRAGAAVNEAAQVDAKAFSKGPAVQSVAPDSSAMASVESESIQIASEMDQVASSIQGSSIDRTESALKEAVSLKVDAIDEQLEGSLFGDIFKVVTMAYSAMFTAGQNFTIGMSGATNATTSAMAMGAQELGAGVHAMAAGASYGVLEGATVGQAAGLLGQYVGDDSAERTAASGRADLAKAGAEKRTSGATEIADRADQERQKSAALTDRIREQRNRLKVTV